MTQKSYMTPRAFAKAVGEHPETIMRLIKSGKLKAKTVLHKRYMVEKGLINSYKVDENNVT